MAETHGCESLQVGLHDLFICLKDKFKILQISLHGSHKFNH